MIEDLARLALNGRFSSGASTRLIRDLSRIGCSDIVLAHDLIPSNDREFDPCA
jgi:hypothetical protein